MRLRRQTLIVTLLLLTGAQQPQSSASDAPAKPAQGSVDSVTIEVQGRWQSAPRRSGQGPMPRHYMVAAWGVPSYCR